MPNRALWTNVALAAMLSASGVAAHAQFTEKTDPQAEIELGRRAAREIEREFRLSPDRASQERVKRVGHAVLDQVEPRVYPFEFKVLAVPEVNAFALPGGFIYVNEGLLTRIPDDNALAFVLAHEATHSAHRHWAGRVKKMEGPNLLAVVGVLAGQEHSAGTGDLVGAIATLALTLVDASYSREDENDADATAMEYLWKAGYDLDGGSGTMQMFQQIGSGHSVPRYLRSHPPTADRLARVAELAQKLAKRPRPQSISAGGAPASPTLEAVAVVGDLSGIEIAANPWFPLAVGNEWSYEVKGAHGRSTYALRIIGAIAAGEHTVYAAETELGTQTGIPCQLVTTATQVWRRSRVSPTQPWRLEMITEVESDHPRLDNESEYRLLGHEEISLPCGRFPAARKMQRQGGTPKATQLLWFVEGVGLVKRQAVESGVTETLVHYRVAPAAPTAPAPAKAEPAPGAG